MRCLPLRGSSLHKSQEEPRMSVLFGLFRAKRGLVGGSRAEGQRVGAQDGRGRKLGPSTGTWLPLFLRISASLFLPHFRNTSLVKNVETSASTRHLTRRGGAPELLGFPSARPGQERDCKCPLLAGTVPRHGPLAAWPSCCRWGFSSGPCVHIP